MSSGVGSLARVRPPREAAITAFTAMVLRDVTVLRKGFHLFLLRTIMQPLLFVFVFTYVFPKIGQGIGGQAGADDFSSLLVPGVVAIACIFQGVQAVALPLVNEFSFTREIEDRVMAPLPVWAVAVEKILGGAIQGAIASLVVFPLAAVIPSTDVHLSINWLELVTFLPLAAVVGAALGLAIGTRADSRQVPLVFSVIIIPITFLGATYYPWATLDSIAWLKIAVLLNPLVYMSEGLRAAMTPQLPHMALPAIYGGLVMFTIVLGWLGISGFKKRVLA